MRAAVCRNDSITPHICSSGPPGRAALALGVEGLYPQFAKQRLHHQGPLLSLVGSWGSRGPIPVSPFTSSQTPRGADITGSGFSSDMPTLHTTVSVLVLLGLTSTIPHFQLHPVSSTQVSSLSLGLCSEDHTSLSLSLPLRMPVPFICPFRVTVEGLLQLSPSLLVSPTEPLTAT